MAQYAWPQCDACRNGGPPALIEWDNDLPPLAALLDEAALAASELAAVETEVVHAAR